jgi:sugar lactone lactonase YvrE
MATDSDGAITQYEWTADGGTFPNGTATEIVPAPGNTIIWSSPATPGLYNITVKVYDSGGPFGGSATATEYLTILVDGENSSPVITSLIPEADSVFVGASIFVVASATDPDGDPLSYQWSATGGTISGDNDIDPEAIIWTAPQTGGDYTITVTVTDGRGGQGSQGVSVAVTVAREAGFIRTPFANPVRIASDSAGQIYVSDTHKNRILVYDQVGDFVREINGLNKPLAVAVSPNGNLYVGEDGLDQVSIFTTSGLPLGALNGQPVQMPNSIDIDTVLGTIFVVDTKAAQVLVFSAAGAFQHSIDGSSAVAGGFVFPAGVAVDAATQTLYVTDGGKYKVYAFGYAGNFKFSFGSMGRGAGKFSRPQGVTVDSLGRVFAVDAYQSYVQVFDTTGQFLASVGTFGTAKGELSVPLDVYVDQFNRLLVTSNDNSRVEVYGLDDDTIPLPKF